MSIFTEADHNRPDWCSVKPCPSIKCCYACQWLEANHWLAESLSILGKDWSVSRNRSIRFLISVLHKYTSLEQPLSLLLTTIKNAKRIRGTDGQARTNYQILDRRDKYASIGLGNSGRTGRTVAFYAPKLHMIISYVIESILAEQHYISLSLIG